MNVTEESLAKWRAEEAERAKLVKLYVLGDRIPQDQLPKYTDFRTLYPITQDGDLVAFAGMKKGWNQCWHIYSLQLAPPGASFNVQDVQPDGASYSCYNKENALSDFVRARQYNPNRFPSRSQLLAAKASAKARELVQSREYLASVQSQHDELSLQLAALDIVMAGYRLPCLDKLVVRLTAERASAADRIIKLNEAIVAAREADTR